MGHRNIETTMDIYAEATEEKKQESFENLAAKLDIFWEVLSKTDDNNLFGLQQIDNKDNSIMTNSEVIIRFINLEKIVQWRIPKNHEENVKSFPTMKSLDAKKGENKAEKASSAAAEAPAAAVSVSAPSVQLDLSKVKIEPLFADDVDFETFSKSDFRVVKVKACEAVKKSKKLLQFTLDDGTGTDRTILSGIHEYYEPEELVGKTCVAITNLPPRKMMGIDSCGMLISAVYEYDGQEGLNLLMLDDSIPAGAKLY